MADGVDEGRGLRFGTVAEQYERYRYGYPDELADVVLGYAQGGGGRPVRTALEVGAGTGKATTLFAARGVRVTALEPDADMAQLLARSVAGLPVDVVVAPFEAYTTDHRFDLLLSAASWHWTDPATRFSRAVDLLTPGGTLALCGSPGEPADPALAAALEEVEREVLVAGHYSAGRPWTDDEFTRAGLADLERHELRRVVPTTREALLGKLGTVSDYLALDPPARAEALRRVAAVLPDEFELDASVRLSLSRRPA